MMNLASDLLDKLDSAGFPVKDVCQRAHVSPSTVAVLRRRHTSCSQKTYDLVVASLIEMTLERQQKMIDAGLVLPKLKASKTAEQSIERITGSPASEEEKGASE